MLDITPSEVQEEFKNKEEKEFQDRFTRMDKDFKLWDLKDVKHEEGPTAINVTRNKPRTYADNVYSKLVASERQIIARMAEKEGEDKREDISKLERLLNFCLDKADERLARMLLPTLEEYIIWSALIRGWAAARILNYKSGKNVIFDYTPLDPRWLVYDVGSDGLSMSIYKTFRSREDLGKTYKYEAPTSSWWNPFSKDKDSFAVLDWWKNDDGKIWNAVVCENDFLKNPTISKIPSMPVLVMPVSTRPPIMDATGMQTERYGDSIYAPNRGMYPLGDKFFSMWFTHAKLHAKLPLLNYYKSNGVTDMGNFILQPEMFVDIPEETNRIEPAPLKEISATLVNAVGILNSWEEQGSLPTLELTSPPPSGTALSIVEEARNRVYGPQLRLLDRFVTTICYLTEEQLLEGKIKVDVKSEKERKYYEYQVKPVDLKKPHIIRVEHTATTAWTQLDTYQIADMAKRQGLPDEFIYEHILKLTDPKGLGDQSAIEIAEHSPKLAILRAIQALIDRGRREEAEQLIEDMYNMSMAEQGGMQGQGPPRPPMQGQIPPGGGI